MDCDLDFQSTFFCDLYQLRRVEEVAFSEIGNRSHKICLRCHTILNLLIFVFVVSEEHWVLLTIIRMTE